MFVLLDARATALDAAAFAWRLLEEKGVAVLDAGGFGPSARGLPRLSLWAEEGLLTTACLRILQLAERVHAERRGQGAAERSRIVAPRAHLAEAAQ